MYGALFAFLNNLEIAESIENSTFKYRKKYISTGLTKIAFWSIVYTGCKMNCTMVDRIIGSMQRVEITEV